MSWFCTVLHCDCSFDHKTRGHECPTCHEFGHGSIECTSGMDRHLKPDQEIPVVQQCTIPGCRFKQFHTTNGHHCGFCSAKGPHECTKRNNTVNRFDQQFIQYAKPTRLIDDNTSCSSSHNKTVESRYTGMGCYIYDIRDCQNRVSYQVNMHSDDWGQYGHCYKKANILASLTC